MRTCTILLFCFTVLLCPAQKTTDALRATYDTATIRQTESNKFMLNNKKLKRKELRSLLLSVPQSAEHYKLFRKKNRVATALWMGSAIAYVAGFFVIAENDALAGSLIVGGLVVSLATIPVSIKAQNELYHSVWLYNREVLSR